MFDTTILQPARTEYVPYEKTVIEKRAPTDESIKLYEEIKEKAYKSILDTIEIKDNLFNIKAIVYDDLLSYSRVVEYEFSLNGESIKGKHVERKDADVDKESLIRAVVLSASEDMANKLTEVLMRDMYGK